MIVYCTTNLVNGRKYIGQDCNDNPAYYGSGTLIKKAINKYGKENFKKEILAHAEDSSQLNDLEKYYIEYYGADQSSLFYNIESGGKSSPCAASTKEKLRIYNTGKKHSQETKDKVSKAFKGRVSPTKGMKMSEETKRKISLANQGKKRTDGFKRRMREIHLGRKATDEQKTKMSISAKKRCARGISEETRKKLSEASKKSWAARKKK